MIKMLYVFLTLNEKDFKVIMKIQDLKKFFVKYKTIQTWQPVKPYQKGNYYFTC